MILLFRGVLVDNHVVNREVPTNEGMYRCVASNPAGSATAAALLKVTGE